MKLILASSSIHRARLLDLLELPYTTCSPEVDETPLPGEAAAILAARLSEAKARAVAADMGDALVIGSDQTAAVDGEFLTKPATEANAVRQLRGLRGRRVTFHTGLCLYNTTQERIQVGVETSTVTFRDLEDPEIEDYVRREQPLDCVGAFRSEGLGIALFSALDVGDPSALVGLPLVRLVEFLGNEGVRVLGQPAV